MRAVARAYAATWRAMLGDVGALLLLFVGGVVYSFFYPLPYSREQVQRVPVAVVDQDRSALSRQLVRYVQAHPALALRGVTPSLDQAQAQLWRGEVAGVLIVPAGLNAQLLSGRAAQVELAGNGAYLLLNKVALGALAEVVGTLSAGIELKRLGASTPLAAQAQAQRQPLTVEPVALFNVREGYGAYVVPGVAVLIVQQTLLMAVAMLMGTWRERGRWPMAPDGPGYLGCWLAFASVPLLNMAYYFGFVYWWQGYARVGPTLALAALALLFALALSALALLIGSQFRSRERSAQLLLATALPLLFLSGLSWPAEALPAALQWLRWLAPSTAGIQGFIALNQLGASWHEVHTEATVLAGLLLAALALGWPRWRERGR